ncbi:MAG TPA: hypothetical protein VNK23_02990 [Candidatus Dormibacteraeota bacterium]|nr:hypothetical protein [Candidatus Dormibacteraeota bacterium]
MLGPVGYAIWFLVLLSEACFVVCALYKREFLRYLPLNLYMLLCVVGNLGVYVCSRTYGVHSREYFYSYYSSDILLSILMYYVIAGLFSQVFADTNFGRYVRGAALMLLGLTALFAFVSVRSNGQHLSTEFVVELEQDLNFVGVILMYVLWGAVIKLRETRARLVQVVLALGVYFSAVAGAYALRNLFPELEYSILRWLPPVIGLWLPLAWTYTFVRVPEEARMASEHMLVTS